MNVLSKTEELRRAALDYLWMHNSGWIEMAELGQPVIMVEGDGIRVKDSEGRTWIDPNGGYVSVNVGYGRTEIAEAAREQMRKLSFQPPGAATEPLIRVSEKIAEIAPGSMERVYPVNGGSESTETAIKIARAYHRRNGEPGRYKVISRRYSYHGATGGVLGMAGSVSADRSDYEPFYPGMIYAPQPSPYRCESGATNASDCAVYSAQQVEELIIAHNPETIAAFIGEPIASNAGNAVPGDEYWPMIRRHLRPLRRPAGVGRGDMRLRSFGRVVWDTKLAHRPGRDGLCQGHREQLHAVRRRGRQEGDRGRLRG